MALTTGPQAPALLQAAAAALPAALVGAKELPSDQQPL